MAKILRRNCPVCRERLPIGSPAWMIYDSKRCADLASKRKKAGERIDAPLPPGFRKEAPAVPCIASRNTPKAAKAPLPPPAKPISKKWPEPEPPPVEKDEDEEDVSPPAPPLGMKSKHTCDEEGCSEPVFSDGKPGWHRKCKTHKKVKPSKKCPIEWCTEEKAYKKHFCQEHADLTSAARRRLIEAGPPKPAPETPKPEPTQAEVMPKALPVPATPTTVQVVNLSAIEEEGDDGQHLRSMVRAEVANDLDRIRLIAEAKGRIAYGQAILDELGIGTRA